MITFVGNLPKSCYVAVSGGSDSMAILNFLTRDGRRDVTVLHYNHGTVFGSLAQKLVEDYCLSNGLKIEIGNISQYKDPLQHKKSPEQYWREARYSFLEKFGSESKPVILGHTLNDQVENWLFTSLHGTPKLIPYKRNQFIRPFITTTRETLVEWCLSKDVPFMDDPANEDRKYMRSIVRHDLRPIAEKINPGLEKVIRKKILESIDL